MGCRLTKARRIVRARVSPFFRRMFFCRYYFDEAWGYTHGDVVGETGMVCSWGDVRPGSLDMPTCSKGICGGHSALDVLPFEVKVCLLLQFFFCFLFLIAFICLTRATIGVLVPLSGRNNSDRREFPAEKPTEYRGNNVFCFTITFFNMSLGHGIIHWVEKRFFFTQIRSRDP